MGKTNNTNSKNKPNNSGGNAKPRPGIVIVGEGANNKNSLSSRK